MLDLCDGTFSCDDDDVSCDPCQLRLLYHPVWGHSHRQSSGALQDRLSSAKFDLVNSQQSLLSVDPELLSVRKELFHLPFLLLISLRCQVLDEEPGEFSSFFIRPLKISNLLLLGLTNEICSNRLRLY
jgi:hypothetical protein